MLPMYSFLYKDDVFSLFLAAGAPSSCASLLTLALPPGPDGLLQRLVVSSADRGRQFPSGPA